MKTTQSWLSAQPARLALRLHTRLPPGTAQLRVTPKDFLRLLWKAIEGWFADSASRYGAAIAYYTLFALAPVLLVVIAIAGFAFGEEAVRGQIVSQIGSLIGRDGALAIQSILQRASEHRQGAGATILGTAVFIFATTGAFLELQAALNRIWRVKTDDSSVINIKAILTRRLRSFGVVVSIGFLLMVSLTVSAAVNAFTAWLGERAAGWPMLILGLNESLSIGLFTLLFAILYNVLPDVRLEWRYVWFGALITALFFSVGLKLIGLYLGRSAIASPFGAAGTIAIILVWVYYCAQIALLGAEFTYQYAMFKRHRAVPPLPGAVRDPVAAT